MSENDIRRVGFLDNGFVVYQPRKGGHRPGMDAVLLAATLPVSTRGLVVDLGAGNGAAGLAVAHRCPDCRVTMVELQQRQVALIDRALDDEDNSHLSQRVSRVEGDVTDTALAGRIGEREPVMHVIANPPFNTQHHRTSPDQDRAFAHQGHDGLFRAWVKAASRLLSHGGDLSLIIRPESLPEALAALSRGFAGVTLRPVHSDERSAAKRILIRARKGSRAAMKILPPIVIHQHDGAFTPFAESVLRGRASIDMDG